MFLAYMKIKIPWKNLSTEQTVVELEGVFVIVVPYFSTSFAIIFLWKLSSLTAVPQSKLRSCELTGRWCYFSPSDCLQIKNAGVENWHASAICRIICFFPHIFALCVSFRWTYIINIFDVFFTYLTICCKLVTFTQTDLSRLAESIYTCAQKSALVLLWPASYSCVVLVITVLVLW